MATVSVSLAKRSTSEEVLNYHIADSRKVSDSKVRLTIIRLWQLLKSFFIPTEPEKFFLHWFLLISIPLCLLLPPFMGPDEASHVYRAYEFSKGDLLLDKLGNGYGYKIPNAIVQLNQDQFWSNSYQPLLTAINHNIHSPSINSPGTTAQYFEGDSVYPPLGYAHFILVTMLSELLGLSAYVGFLSLRFSNIILYAILAFAAIKIAPKRKWFFAMVALLPMAIHEATVVSPDAVINGAALLSVAFVAKLIVEKKIASRKTLLLLAFVVFVTAFDKQAYLFFPLLLFLIPSRAFLSPLRKKLYILLVFVAVWGCLGLWTLASSASSTAAFSTWRTRDNFGQTYTAKEFVKNIAEHPIQSAEFVTHSFIYNIAPKDQATAFSPEFYAHNRQANFTIESYLGAFGSLMIGYPIWVYFIVVAGIALPLVAEEYVYIVLTRLRLFIWGILLLQFIVLMFVFWLKWTAKTDPGIVGFQGRYLIPLTGLLVFLPTGKYIKLALRKDLLPKLLGAAIFIEGAMMLIVVASRFYVGV